MKAFGAALMALTIMLASSAAQAQAQSQAQAVTCDPTGAQAQMNACAFDDFKRADAALNAMWKRSMAAAKQSGVADDLRAAQRMWLPYRDAACAAEAAIFEGGTMQPLILYSCLATLTEERTKHLSFFLDM